MKNIIKSLVDTILGHNTKGQSYKVISTYTLMMKKASNLRNHYSAELESIPTTAPISSNDNFYKIVYRESPNAMELTDMPNDASTDGVFFFHHLTKEQAIEVAKQLNSLDDYMYGKKSINPKDPIFYAAVQETKWKG